MSEWSTRRSVGPAREHSQLGVERRKVKRLPRGGDAQLGFETLAVGMGLGKKWESLEPWRQSPEQHSADVTEESVG